MFIEEFKKWLELNSQRLSEHRISISASENEGYLESPSMTAEVEGEKIMGVIIVWEIGCCDIHIISNDENAEELITERYDLNRETELISILDISLNKIMSL